jgi:hypothetical protein
MNAEEFKVRALDHLDRLETADMEAAITDQRSVDLFTELHGRWNHARLAFPGMTWEEFSTLSRKRTAGRGRPKVSELEKGDKPLIRAARDVSRIRELWREMAGKRRDIPADPIEIAARRHGVDEVELGELVRRPLSRR